ncbi:MAG: hypothetical protein ACE5HR_00165 [bacterium]
MEIFEDVKTPIGEVLERYNVYSANLERDLLALQSRVGKVPEFLETVGFTEGIIRIPGNGNEECYLKICGLTDEARIKGREVYTKKNLALLEEAKNLAFRDCVIEIKGIKFERNVREYKRGDEVPLLYEIKNRKEAEELVQAIPQKIRNMVYDGADYLSDFQKDELKNWNMPSRS